MTQLVLDIAAIVALVTSGWYLRAVYDARHLERLVDERVARSLRFSRGGQP